MQVQFLNFECIVKNFDMLFHATNIEEKLHRYKQRKGNGDRLLAEVEEMLRKDRQRDEGIADRLGRKDPATGNAFDFDLLETERIYHLEQIRKICIDYRLRFLDSAFFKGEIPQGALSRIKTLEDDHRTQIKGFKIMAPSKLFKLEDRDDPLLFAPIGNDYFYLVHKWGRDLHPLRKWLAWPFKSLVNLVLVVLAISCCVALLVPEGLFSKKSTPAEFWILFFFMFKCIASVVIYYGFALGKNFSPAIWNNKYFNT